MPIDTNGTPEVVLAEPPRPSHRGRAGALLPRDTRRAGALLPRDTKITFVGRLREIPLPRPSWQALSATAGVLPFIHLAATRSGLSSYVVAATVVSGFLIASFAKLKSWPLVPTFVGAIGELSAAIAGMNGWLDMTTLRGQVVWMIAAVLSLCLAWEALAWLCKYVHGRVEFVATLSAV